MGLDEINGNRSGESRTREWRDWRSRRRTEDARRILQSSLLQDGGSNGSTTRIVTIDIETGVVVHEYGYTLDNIGTAANPKYGMVSEILALNDHEFLVDERDGQGLGDGSVASLKRLYKNRPRRRRGRQRDR